MFKKPFLPLLLLAALGTAQAQTAAPTTPATAPATTKAAAAPSQQLTAEQQAELDRQNDQISKAALQVTLLVDQNKAGEVWDGASQVAKQAVTRATFVNQVTRDRSLLGALSSREVKNIKRMRSNGKQVPAGDYISVIFSSQFANAKQPMRELVSFHLDPDDTWRVTGYTLH